MAEGEMMVGEVSSWNDDRLDELNRRMENGFTKVDREMKEGFTRVDEQFVRLEGEMKEGFTKVDRKMNEGFAEVRGELRSLGERFDSLLNILVLISWGFAGTLFTAFVGLVVALLI